MSGGKCMDFGASSIPVSGQKNVLCLVGPEDEIRDAKEGELKISPEGLVTFSDGNTALLITEKTEKGSKVAIFRSQDGKDQIQYPITDAMKMDLIRQHPEVAEVKTEYSGLVTYANGRVADFVSETDSNVTFKSQNGKFQITVPKTDRMDMKRIREYQGMEIGKFDAANNLLLPDSYEGSNISWGIKEMKEINRIFGQDKGQAGNAFFCVNAENMGSIALAADKGHASRALGAIQALEKDHGSLDDVHYHALMASLRLASGVPAPPDDKGKHADKSATDLIKEYWPLALLFGVNGPGQLIKLVQTVIKYIKDNRKPPSGPGTGTGSGDTKVSKPTTVTEETSSSAFWLATGALLAAGTTMFLLRRAGGKEAELKEGEGKIEVRELAGKLDLPVARPVVRETNAGNGGLNVFDLMGGMEPAM
ncbi:MAG TPA: hypothetical protein VFX30_08350 [bacterium]|nr:hypothetical protein [bacterium]